MMTFLQFYGHLPKFLHSNYTTPFPGTQPLFTKNPPKEKENPFKKLKNLRKNCTKTGTKKKKKFCF